MVESPSARSSEITGNKSPYKKSRFASISFEDPKQAYQDSSCIESKREIDGLSIRLNESEQKLTIAEDLNEEVILEEKPKQILHQTSIELFQEENPKNEVSMATINYTSSQTSIQQHREDVYRKNQGLDETFSQLGSQNLRSKTMYDNEDAKICKYFRNESESPFEEDSTTLKSENCRLSEQNNLFDSTDNSQVYNDKEEEAKSIYDIVENQNVRRMPRLTMNSRRLTASLEQIQVPLLKLEKTSNLIETQSLSSSPIGLRKRTATADSGLLQRRLSRRDSCHSSTSVPSGASSTVRNYSRMNSLDLSKSPENVLKKEAKLNQSYQVFLANRPQSWEENAVSIILEAVKENTNARVVLQNLSLASSLLKVREKKKSNEAFFEKIFADTSPAYLSFSSNMIKDGETKFKVSPPIRNKENRELLVENMRLGGVDMLSSYNFFVPSRFKLPLEGNFRMAFGGVESIGCSLQATWTSMYCHQYKNNPKFKDDQDYRKKMVNQFLMRMCATLCQNPAKVLKISHCKGSIKKGMDADLVIWDPYKIESHDSLSRGHLFAEKQLLGVVHKTYLRGNLIYSQEKDDQVNHNCVPRFIKAKRIVN